MTDERMKCLTVRDERGEVVMVSEAMTDAKLADRKEFLVESGVEEDRIVAVSKEMGRSLKKQHATIIFTDKQYAL